MTGEAARDGLARLAAGVLDFERGPYSLRRDLEALLALRELPVPEAVILYAARALEVFAMEGVARLGPSPMPRVFENLELLRHFGLLDGSDLQVAHATRACGNAARHVSARHGPADGDAALVLTAHLLRWFFCRFALGPRLPGLTRDGEPWSLAHRGEAVELLEAVTRAAEEVTPLDAHWLEVAEAGLSRGSHVHATAVSIAAETLIARDDACSEAWLAAGLRHVPDHPRLLHLEGLRRRRQGDLEGACEILEPVFRRHRRDEEVAGTLAATYKEMWAREGSGPWLERARRIYERAWQTSEGRSTWHGINVAATSLWLGERERANRTAAAVLEALERRGEQIERAGGRVAPPYWDDVTVAEALLYTDRPHEALDAYASAFERHPEQRGSFRTTCEQGLRALRHVAGPATPALRALLERYVSDA